MGDTISSIKEFIWDIIGYLIPGFLCIIMLNFFLSPSVTVSSSFLINWQQFNITYVIIVLSYALGFIVYSLTLLKITVQDYLIDKLKKYKRFKSLEKKHSKYWEIGFKTSATFALAQSFLVSKGFSNATSMQINEVRNILMSRNPEMDQKVYTFMFRSSVFDHISTLMLLFSLLGLIQAVFCLFDVYYIKTDTQYIVLYVLFLFLSSPLGNAKRIFYSMSKRIPFSNLK